MQLSFRKSKNIFQNEESNIVFCSLLIYLKLLSGIKHKYRMNEIAYLTRSNIDTYVLQKILKIDKLRQIGIQ